jgi:hypothetical protein
MLLGGLARRGVRKGGAAETSRPKQPGTNQLGAKQSGTMQSGVDKTKRKKLAEPNKPQSKDSNARKGAQR